jgi:hypothetical protein
MSASSFRINQPPASGYTYWDRARRDLALGDVECEAQNTSESSYLWEIISGPPGETITITNPTSPTCQFTLSTRYGYLVRLTVNEGEIDESQTTLYMGVPLANSGASLPAMNETNQDNSQSPYDGSRGTEEKVNDALIKFDGGYSWIYDGTDDYLYPQSATARIKGASGTLANPTLGFKDDIDTGVYLPSTGVMSFASGGAEVLRMHVDTGDPYVDVAGAENFYIRNEGNPSGIGVSTHIESRTTNSDPTGASVNILSEAYEATSSSVSAQAKSPGGTSNATFTASTVGVAGGSSTFLARAIGAGLTTATVSSTTTGAYAAEATLSSESPSSATVNIQATSSSNAAIINIEPSGNDATSYLNLGGAHARITFTDYLRTGSTYTSAMPLSGAQSHWNNFVTEFGVTSLLDGVYKAAHQTLQSAYDSGYSITTTVGTPVSITGDLYVSNELDVVTSINTSNIQLQASAEQTVFSALYYSNTHFSMFLDSEGMMFSAPHSNKIIFTDPDNIGKEHDHNISYTDPTLVLYSGYDVDLNDDLYAYFTVSDAGNLTIYSKSGYTRIGILDTPDFALATGDLYVSKTFEAKRVLANPDNIEAGIVLYQAGSEYFSMVPYTDDGVHFATSSGSGRENNHVIFTVSSNSVKDHDRSAYSSDPEVYFFSGTNVDIDNNQWIAISRRSTYAEILFGDYYASASHLYIQNSVKTYGPVCANSVPLLSATGTSLQLDLNKGNFLAFNQGVNLTAVSITTPVGAGRWQIMFTGLGSYTIDWSGWHWDGPQPPFSIANGEKRIMTLYYDGSGNYYASMSGVFS